MKRNNNITPLLSEIERWIRDGKAVLARQAIVSRASKPFEREERAQWAALARRSNLPLVSLKLLASVVRPARRVPYEPDFAELTEYAAALLRVGAFNEAISLLNKIPGREYPDAWLFRAFALFSQWEYGGAIEWLRSYVGVADLSDYWRQVGRVNLAAALVFEKQAGEANSLLQKLRAETEAEGNMLLLGNVLELMAQNAISEKRWRDARENLTSAARLVERGEGLNGFFILKWKAILDFLASGTPASARQLTEVRKEAQTLQHWETVRDLDLFRAKATGDEPLLRHLYFGSPLPAYRKRITSETCFHPDLSYEWQLGPRGTHQMKCDPLGNALKPGTTLFRLFDVLSSDFYRPFRIPALHEQAYPGEYFNPYSGFNRVRKVLQRLRNSLKANGLPLKINEHQGTYRLTSTRPLALKVTRSETAKDPVVRFLDRLGARLQESTFSARDAASQSGSSHRTVNRLLSLAETRGLVRKSGQTRAIRYQIRK